MYRTLRKVTSTNMTKNMYVVTPRCAAAAVVSAVGLRRPTKEYTHPYSMMHRRLPTAGIEVAPHYHQLLVASSSSLQVPRSECCAKRVTPLESSHGHHLPVRAASARAARGSCFDLKRAVTAPGCRACPVTREHCVGSLFLVGQNHTQVHSSSSTRSSSITADDDLHIHRYGKSRLDTNVVIHTCNTV